MNTHAKTNPLLCHTEEGFCEIPAESFPAQGASKQKPIHILYFTDPICSSCLAIEPQLRKLTLEYGDIISIEYRMGGMLPSWDIYKGGLINTPADVARHWDMISPLYEMPIDGDVWIKDPLHSSYPPSIAFKAAQMQNQDKAVLFLRRIREMVFFEKKNITRWPHLKKAAKDVFLNPLQLRVDYKDKAPTLFREDLDLAGKLHVKDFQPCFLVVRLMRAKGYTAINPITLLRTRLKNYFPGQKKKPLAPAGKICSAITQALPPKSFPFYPIKPSKKPKCN